MDAGNWGRVFFDGRLGPEHGQRTICNSRRFSSDAWCKAGKPPTGSAVREGPFFVGEGPYAHLPEDTLWVRNFT